MRTKAAAEAAEAILTKFLRETRNSFGRASALYFIASSPHKFVAVPAHTYDAAHAPHRVPAGCTIRGFRHSNCRLRSPQSANCCSLLASLSQRVKRMFSMSQRNEIIFLHAGDENLDSSACLSYDCSVCIREHFVEIVCLGAFPEIHVAGPISEPVRTTPGACSGLINLWWIRAADRDRCPPRHGE